MSKLSELLRTCIRRVEDLRPWIPLTDQEVLDLEQVARRYPLCIPPYYLQLVDPRDPDDPIGRMCLPAPIEELPGGVADTSGEQGNTVVRGMQHKYAQTALILSTNQCSMYCRHCFRKRMVGATAGEVVADLREVRAYVEAHPEINNVLISGGDAFLNENQVLQQYLEAFTGLPSIEFIRFGTRVPVVLPQRISQDPELLALLRQYGSRKQILVVTQFNHPREITREACQAISMLLRSGILLRNQTVLLRGVNDDPAVLGKLQNQLVKAGVLPYYIFQCRPAAGVKNQFQVPLQEGSRIVEEARKCMSGQAKSARYCMSHVTGKIEILGENRDGEMVFKYHQAKDMENFARIFTRKLEAADAWLPENETL